MFLRKYFYICIFTKAFTGIYVKNATGKIYAFWWQFKCIEVTVFMKIFFPLEFFVFSFSTEGLILKLLTSDLIKG